MIFMVLLLVYRSVITVVLLLITVGVELFAGPGNHRVSRRTIFCCSRRLPSICWWRSRWQREPITGYSSPVRYQEARQAGEHRETAYYTTYRGVTPVVLGSGLTIAGAMLCLSFTGCPSSSPWACRAPSACSSVMIALTLVPAVLTVGSRFRLFDPRRRIRFRRWRRVGTAIVRWPAPVFVTTLAVALIGLVTLPGYKTSYDDRLYIPKDIPANLGYAAADRHFCQPE